jgi:hypothetical protein
MALDVKSSHPTMKPEERGRDAWTRPQPQPDTVLGKRTSQEAELPPPPGKRKIRRALSKKLSSQHDAIWSDIATIPANEVPEKEFSTNDQHHPAPALSNLGTSKVAKTGTEEGQQDPEIRERIDYPVLKSHGSVAIFSGIQVHVYGFSAHKVSPS